MYFIDLKRLFMLSIDGFFFGHENSIGTIDVIQSNRIAPNTNVVSPSQQIKANLNKGRHDALLSLS
ncbi:CLUMA_CG014636, isoform A [Clunio marinus]|uniref:CLUMA_CG014636, isoform A n=1 Tax=Clunio marinus TaxID=568069 RepID=A0A1J1IMW7_9DIPT|nr:CLUMA_CG014636, isoform A [Clunio marinus]